VKQQAGRAGPLSRRRFLRATALVVSAVTVAPSTVDGKQRPTRTVRAPSIAAADLPRGSSPHPVAIPHFPDRLHAFVWRNWSLVPIAKLAEVVGATPDEIRQVAISMGLPKAPRITRDQQRRSYITVIKRNWHLLPYEQLLTLLDWTPEQMAYALREDDFLFIKLGSLKPKCEPIKFSLPNETAMQAARKIARVLKEEFPDGLAPAGEPLFGFVAELSSKPPRGNIAPRSPQPSLRFCYSYFALYGDPLLDSDADPYPDGYLARLAQSGVNGVWLQAVLYKLAPFPWDPTLSVRHEERLKNLRNLVARARRHGVGVYLYLNEPRSMPLQFFEAHRELKGVSEGEHAALCTSQPDVQRHLTRSVATICRAVPDLAGLFTITASENLTSCWSHGTGRNCPRCAQRPPSEGIAEVNRLIAEGIARAKSRARLLVWDWGWNDPWAADVIRQLPRDATLMSVSEWSLPIERGGVQSKVGEYSISAVGPGPRATRHWQIARECGLKTVAKIQAGNTWELSAVPYIPAVENVARHATNLRQTNVDGLMLGWTLGGYPSPNLEVVGEICHDASMTPADAMLRVAARRFGKTLAPAVVTAWSEFSAAFSEFPFHVSLVYSAPFQVGPANALWAEPTGYQASMVGFPYDHLDAWRAIYPPEVFVDQLEKVADGFDTAIIRLSTAAKILPASRREHRALRDELNVAEAASIHFRSVANQARFVLGRDALARAAKGQPRNTQIALLEKVLRDELALAKQLFGVQSRDSRIGFEASNHYFYVPFDLAEKVINCRDLLDRWLQRGHHEP
jgi:hypothetical protein